MEPKGGRAKGGRAGGAGRMEGAWRGRRWLAELGRGRKSSLLSTPPVFGSTLAFSLCSSPPPSTPLHLVSGPTILLLFCLSIQTSLSLGQPFLNLPSSRSAQSLHDTWSLITTPHVILSQPLTQFVFISPLLKNICLSLNYKRQDSKDCAFDSPL